MYKYIYILYNYIYKTYIYIYVQYVDGFFLISSLNFHFFDGDRWGILWSWSRTRGRHLATLVPGDVARAGAKLLDEVGGV